MNNLFTNNLSIISIILSSIIFTLFFLRNDNGDRNGLGASIGIGTLIGFIVSGFIVEPIIINIGKRYFPSKELGHVFRIDNFKEKYKTIYTLDNENLTNTKNCIAFLQKETLSECGGSYVNVEKIIINQKEYLSDDEFCCVNEIGMWRECDFLSPDDDPIVILIKLLERIE